MTEPGREGLAVRMIDPGFSVFHYDIELSLSLSNYLDDFVLFAPDFIPDPTYPAVFQSVRRKGWSVQSLGMSKNARIGFVSGKVLDYMANQAYVLASLMRERTHPIVHVQFLSLLQRKWIDLPWLAQVKRHASALVYTAHNVLPHDLEQDPTAIERFRQVYSLADHLVVHTERQHQELLERFEIPARKISIIPMGPFFHRLLLPEKSVARRELGLDSGPVLLHFGGMRPYKGTELLLRAFARLRQDLGTGTLLLVGAATPERKQVLRQLTADLGLAEHVHEHFEYTSSSALAVYFAAADLAVLPYHHIDQSASLLSELSLGVPVVVSDVGGFSELVGANDLGFLCQPRSEDSLVSVLREALLQPEVMRAKADRARSFVEQKLNWDDIARDTLRMYQTLN